MKRRKVGRWVCLGLTVALFAAAAWFAYSSHRKHRQFLAWTRDVPTEFVIDLSKPGTTRAPFRQTCDVAHSENLYIDPASGPLPDHAEWERKLAGLEGEVVLVASNGREMQRSAFPESLGYVLPGFEGPTHLAIADFGTIPRGEYTIAFTIHKAAPMMADTPMRAYARYELCGMEAMPAALDGLASLALGVVGMVLLAVSGILFAGDHIRRAKAGGRPSAI